MGAATAYCGTNDLDRFHEDFTIGFYGSFSPADGDFPDGTIFAPGTLPFDDMGFAFDSINESLRSIAKIKQVPVGTQSNGKYPPAMTEWNAKLTIYNKLKARHLKESPHLDLPAWVDAFLNDCIFIRNSILVGDIVFDEDVSLSESGINKPEIIDWDVFGTGWMPISNWNTGDTYRRDNEDIYYYFKSTAESNLTTATCATFAVRKGSRDLPPIGTIVLGVDGRWTDVEYGLKLRIELDQPKNIDGSMQSAIAGTVVENAEFRVRCISENIRAYGDDNYARSFQLGRG